MDDLRLNDGRLIVNRSIVYRVRDSSGSLAKWMLCEAMPSGADGGRHR